MRRASTATPLSGPRNYLCRSDGQTLPNSSIVSPPAPGRPFFLVLLRRFSELQRTGSSSLTLSRAQSPARFTILSADLGVVVIWGVSFAYTGDPGPISKRMAFPSGSHNSTG
ncbi:hypothetical protein IAQ61_007375 [Plenodomus lingam]|uniref:uncharacterized protein n=1 Tax=Leptosphaeria maculans TaxID=5022 RepID=UPI00331FCDDD|nr:hypothetical protein IAQ61_007375 [Plenodomus lingam]